MINTKKRKEFKRNTKESHQITEEDRSKTTTKATKNN